MSATEAVPAHGLPLEAWAPGKAILFGEHAVVFGHTAIVLALERGTHVALSEAPAGGAPRHRGLGDPEANPYLRTALQKLGDGRSLEVGVRTELPRASGLGSSAAFTSALICGLLALRGGAPRPRLAEESFRCEHEAQGLGSPVDTSAAVAGGVLGVGAAPPGELLWELPPVREGARWKITRLADPGWTWVVGYTGVAKDTAEVVRKVGQRVRSPDGPELLQRISSVTGRGVEALRAKDRAGVGEAMRENQRCLVDLGISHPRLEELLASVDRHALGAKITGAGGGGSILALPKEGEEVEAGRAISRAGGVPFLVRVSHVGASLR